MDAVGCCVVPHGSCGVPLVACVDPLGACVVPLGVCVDVDGLFIGCSFCVLGVVVFVFLLPLQATIPTDITPIMQKRNPFLAYPFHLFIFKYSIIKLLSSFQADFDNKYFIGMNPFSFQRFQKVFLLIALL